MKRLLQNQSLIACDPRVNSAIGFLIFFLLVSISHGCNKETIQYIECDEEFSTNGDMSEEDFDENELDIDDGEKRLSPQNPFHSYNSNKTLWRSEVSTGQYFSLGCIPNTFSPHHDQGSKSSYSFAFDEKNKQALVLDRGQYSDIGRFLIVYYVSEQESGVFKVIEPEELGISEPIWDIFSEGVLYKDGKLIFTVIWSLVESEFRRTTAIIELDIESKSTKLLYKSDDPERGLLLGHIQFIDDDVLMIRTDRGYAFFENGELTELVLNCIGGSFCSYFSLRHIEDGFVFDKNSGRGIGTIYEALVTLVMVGNNQIEARFLAGEVGEECPQEECPHDGASFDYQNKIYSNFFYISSSGPLVLAYDQHSLFLIDDTERVFKLVAGSATNNSLYLGSSDGTYVKGYGMGWPTTGTVTESGDLLVMDMEGKVIRGIAGPIDEVVQMNVQ